MWERKTQTSSSKLTGPLLMWQRLCLLTCDRVCLCACYTICLVILLGLSLQSLAKELLLLGEVLFNEAILAHLLTYLQHKKAHKTALYTE